MKSEAVETILGAVVLVVAGIFLFYLFNQSEAGQPANAYDLTARFNRVDGITPGSDVRVSGIKIGAVKSQRLDPDTYLAVLDLAIDGNVKIPTDSSVKIASEGLLGGSYVAIEPGGSSQMMTNGEEFVYAQGSIDLFGLIGQAITAIGGDNK